MECTASSSSNLLLVSPWTWPSTPPSRSMTSSIYTMVPLLLLLFLNPSVVLRSIRCLPHNLPFSSNGSRTSDSNRSSRLYLGVPVDQHPVVGPSVTVWSSVNWANLSQLQVDHLMMEVDRFIITIHMKIVLGWWYPREISIIFRLKWPRTRTGSTQPLTTSMRILSSFSCMQ